MPEESRKYDLEDRLVKFAIMILGVRDILPHTRAAKNENIVERIKRNPDIPKDNKRKTCCTGFSGRDNLKRM